MFYSNVLPTVTNFNQFLQRDDPSIHLLKDQCERFLQKLLGRFAKVSVIKAAEKVPDVDFSDKDNQLDDSNLAVGYIVKQKLKNIVDEGDISPDNVHKFYEAAWCYFVAAAAYAISHLPFNGDVLHHTNVVGCSVIGMGDYYPCQRA